MCAAAISWWQGLKVSLVTRDTAMVRVFIMCFIVKRVGREEIMLCVSLRPNTSTSASAYLYDVRKTNSCYRVRWINSRYDLAIVSSVVSRVYFGRIGLCFLENTQPFAPSLLGIRQPSCLLTGLFLPFPPSLSIWLFSSSGLDLPLTSLPLLFRLSPYETLITQQGDRSAINEKRRRCGGGNLHGPFRRCEQGIVIDSVSLAPFAARSWRRAKHEGERQVGRGELGVLEKRPRCCNPR